MLIRLRADVKVFSSRDRRTETFWRGKEVEVSEQMIAGDPWLVDKNGYGLRRSMLRDIPHATLLE